MVIMAVVMEDLMEIQDNLYLLKKAAVVMPPVGGVMVLVVVAGEQMVGIILEEVKLSEQQVVQVVEL